MRWILLVAASARVVIWLAMLAWNGLALILWAGTRPESAIHQCVGAAQTAAHLIAGYVIARGCTFILKEGEIGLSGFLKKSEEAGGPDSTKHDNTPLEKTHE